MSGVEDEDSSLEVGKSMYREWSSNAKPGRTEAYFGTIGTGWW